jgi:hypothetical protein
VTAGGRAITAVIVIAAVLAIAYVLGDIGRHLLETHLAGAGR